MSSSIDHDASPAPLPDNLPLAELPPVKPPSAVFILQLFVIPGVIVLAIVGVWVLFGRLASSEQDWRSLVVELKHPNEHRRWRAAHGLAQVLNADRDLGPQGHQLAKNAEIAQSLADTLAGELKRGSKAEPDLNFQAFLARTLGLFDLPRVVLPPLQGAMRLEHEREAGDVREQMLEVRKNSLGAVAVLAGRLDEAGQPIESRELVDTLIDVSTSDDRLIRQVSGFTLGILVSPQATGRLHELLDDADELTRINAAIGLARHGDTAGFRVLKVVLTSASTPIASGSPQEFERFVSLKNSLAAIGRLSDRLSAAEHTEAVSLVQPVARTFHEPSIRHTAIQTLQKLEQTP